MTTIPTDLLARLRAVLTAAEAMTPGPWTVHLPSSLDRDDLAHIETPDRTCEWQWFAWDEPGAEENMRGLVALRNATADLAALLALVEAPVSVPTWTVEPYGRDGLLQHTITRGDVRLTVRSGYDDFQTFAQVTYRTVLVRSSWFGGMLHRVPEAIAEAKAAALGWAREIGAVALVETPAPHVDRDDLALAMVAAGDNSGHADAIRSGRTPLPGWALAAASVAIARLTGQAPAPLTVGAALADPRVQDGSHGVEYRDGGMWRQLRSAKRESLLTRAFLQGFRGSPPERAMSWSAWMSTRSHRDSAEVWAEEYALPCRLVPLTVADLDPATRGPL